MQAPTPSHWNRWSSVGLEYRADSEAKVIADEIVASVDVHN
jgi:hypothetical protein